VRQRIDWIERTHIYAELVGFRTKRTDPARHIQHSLSYQVIRLKEEIAAILFECATKQNYAIKSKAALRVYQIVVHAHA
jgi:hypothetical protein